MTATAPVQAVRQLLTNASLADGRRVDIALEGASIAGIAPAGSATTAGAATDLDGWLVLPAFVEPHAHLDKTLTIGEVSNDTGDLRGAIDAWLAHRTALDAASFERRGLAGIRRAVLHGVGVLRTHVDTGAGLRLAAVERLRALADELRDVVEVQLVAGCGLPVTGAGGAANRARLAEAIDIGIDAVGGAPSLDPDPRRAVDVLAEIAASHGLPLDLHIDETLDPSVFVLPHLAAVAAELPVAVTAGHCVSLAVQPPDVQRRVAAQLAAAGVAVVALPQTNLYLQGRDAGSAAPRGVTAVRALLEAGVTVAAGCDNVADPFNPVGRGDPLETASLMVTTAHLGVDEALTSVTTAARQAVGAAPGGLQVGASADLVAINAADATDAIGRAAAERIVFHRGVAVATTSVQERWAGAPV